MKHKLLFAICALTAVTLLSGCCLKHEWKEATCTEPKTCIECEKTEGETIAHQWQPATCKTLETCTTCGETKGELLPHTWEEATCESPQRCALCPATEGEALPHEWEEATCENPQSCSVCSATEGEPLPHQWQKATCIEAKTCGVCGTTEGEPLSEHSLDNEGKCTLCQEQIGFALNLSNYSSYIKASLPNGSVDPSDTMFTTDGNIPTLFLKFTVEPLKNVEFHNIRLEYAVRAFDSGNDYFPPVNTKQVIYLDEKGYVSHTLKLKGVKSAPQRWIYPPSVKCELIKVSGYIVE